MKVFVRLLLACLPVVACQNLSSDDAVPAPAAGEPSPSAVEYKIDGETLVGRLSRTASPVTFTIVSKGGALFDVTVELNGLVLAALVSDTEQAFDLDGFTAGTGVATQMREEDRIVLKLLHDAVAADQGLKEQPAGALLEHVSSVWSQMSDTFPLARSFHVDTDRSYASLCNVCGQFLQGTHDCNVCGDWDPKCTSTAQLGTRESGTQYFINGGWVGSLTPDHIPDLFERGDCFGNCGDACAAFGEEQLTEDCLDHDQCVRNGHRQALSFCDDEFSRAIDDEIAAPNCSRLVADTYTVNCKATKNFKGWYVIQSCSPCPAGTSPSGYTNAGHPTQYPSLKCSAPAHWVCP